MREWREQASPVRAASIGVDVAVGAGVRTRGVRTVQALVLPFAKRLLEIAWIFSQTVQAEVQLMYSVIRLIRSKGL